MKNIVIRDEIYEALSKMKKDREAFSDVILRLIDEKKNRSFGIFEEYAGSLKESDLFEVVMENRVRVRDFDL
jgi:Uncharacterized conserved protein